jgi:two-component system chemotaxis response regulator CheB
MNTKIRVLVVDDSALVRRTIVDILSMDPDIEVVGTANDPLIAMEKIPRLQPDVMTLDMEMPRMDGLTFLRQLQTQGSSIQVVVISSLTQQGSQIALDAMDAGAIDVLAKPDGQMSIGALASKLAFHVKAAANARRMTIRPQTERRPAEFQSSAKAVGRMDRRIIVIGSSTGGVEALRYLLPQLPDGLPPILIAQHIPAFFSKAVADRINHLTPYQVREAIDDEPLHSGLCLIAPGNFHLMVVMKNGVYRTRLVQSPPVHHCRPSVDVLFRSVAEVAGPHVVAALLTGMGSDGALGMQNIARAGGITLAEHESSCIVFGMPRAAIELGAAKEVVPLDHMADRLVTSIQATPM